METTGGCAQVDHFQRMAAHSRAIQGEARALLTEAQGAARDAESLLVAHPWRVALAAMGLGYVLGGGLLTRLTGRMLRLGARTLLLPAIEGELCRLLPPRRGES